MSKPVSRSRKLKLIELANFKCYTCGWSKHPEILEVHHKIFRSKKGNSEDVNLVVLCPNCHRFEHNKLVKWGVLNTREYDRQRNLKMQKTKRYKEYKKKYYLKHRIKQLAESRLKQKSINRTCRQCGKEYNKLNSDFNNYCSVKCRKISNYDIKNNWLENNMEKHKESCRNWLKRNPDKTRLYHQNWKTKHPQKYKEVYTRYNNSKKVNQIVKI